MAEVVGFDRERGGRRRAAWPRQNHAVESRVDGGLGALHGDGGICCAVSSQERQTRELVQRECALIDGNGGLDGLRRRGIVRDLNGVAVGGREGDAAADGDLVTRQDVDGRVVERSHGAMNCRGIGQAVAVIDRVGKGWRAEITGIGCVSQLTRIERDGSAGDGNAGRIAGSDGLAIHVGDTEPVGLSVGIVGQGGHRDRGVLRRIETIIDGVGRRDDGDGDRLDARRQSPARAGIAVVVGGERQRVEARVIGRGRIGQPGNRGVDVSQRAFKHHSSVGCAGAGGKGEAGMRRQSQRAVGDRERDGFEAAVAIDVGNRKAGDSEGCAGNGVLSARNHLDRRIVDRHDGHRGDGVRRGEAGRIRRDECERAVTRSRVLRGVVIGDALDQRIEIGLRHDAATGLGDREGAAGRHILDAD